MAADTVAAPRLSLNVRYNRNVEENSGEEEENQVEILEDEEDYAELEPQIASSRSPAAGNRRSFRATAVTLGGFYLLLLAGLFICFTLLHTRYDQLSSNYSQIQRKVSDISVEKSQLQDEVKELKCRIKEKLCPDGWKGFGCSCYFKSKKEDYWYGRRDDCEQRGAHLVVINNEEEQKFVTELSKDGQYWIGLQKEQRQGEQNPGEWKWVDGSPLTETFWASGMPHNDVNYKAATCCDQQGKWTQRRFNDYKKWICEEKDSLNSVMTEGCVVLGSAVSNQTGLEPFETRRPTNVVGT
ncbi:CD209 antigen-like protein E [Perca flavescens]|uniref:CD209 antigen-like protein E n=1 Tax=Perca flavescens TaxID=8167 RepID=UPI00106E5463|nr:CD209 antigen-like protein E [Perca flavescens]